MLASKPAPAMTANRSPFRLTTSIWRGRPAARSRPRRRWWLGRPRLEASRFAVPAGMIATRRPAAGQRVDAPLRHAVAAPHEEVVGALLAETACTCLGASRLFGTSAHIGSSHPVLGERCGEAAAGHLRASCRHGRPRRSLRHDATLPGQLGGLRGASGGERHHQGSDADQHGRAHVGRMVHSAIHAREAPPAAGSRWRSPRQAIRRPVLRIREVISSARPQ